MAKPCESGFDEAFNANILNGIDVVLHGVWACCVNQVDRRHEWFNALWCKEGVTNFMTDEHFNCGLRNIPHREAKHTLFHIKGCGFTLGIIDDADVFGGEKASKQVVRLVDDIGCDEWCCHVSKIHRIWGNANEMQDF